MGADGDLGSTLDRNGSMSIRVYGDRQHPKHEVQAVDLLGADDGNSILIL